MQAVKILPMGEVVKKVRHPAKYSKKLIPVIADFLGNPITYDRYLNAVQKRVLDPFAGTGFIFDVLPQYDWYGVEIEPEWAALHARTRLGNALNLPFDNEFFHAVASSPAYGNRLADHHVAKDGSKRINYREAIGHELHAENGGRLHWGTAYQTLHYFALKECYRVLQPDGLLIWNVKNHIRKGKEVDVIGWYKDVCERLGFRLVEEKLVELRGIRFGANHQARVKTEWVGKFRKWGEG